jgi:hypothetical protein
MAPAAAAGMDNQRQFHLLRRPGLCARFDTNFLQAFIVSPSGR